MRLTESGSRSSLGERACSSQTSLCWCVLSFYEEFRNVESPLKSIVLIRSSPVSVKHMDENKIV